MGLPDPAKTLFDLGLRSSRLPLDVALHLSGHRDTPLQLTVDRLEAGMRSAAGALFDDEELRRQGERGLSAARERERLAGLRRDDPTRASGEAPWASGEAAPRAARD